MCVCSLILCVLVLFFPRVTSDPVYFSSINYPYKPHPLPLRGLRQPSIIKGYKITDTPLQIYRAPPPLPFLPPLTRNYKITNNSSKIYRAPPPPPLLPSRVTDFKITNNSPQIYRTPPPVSSPILLALQSVVRLYNTTNNWQHLPISPQPPLQILLQPHLQTLPQRPLQTFPQGPLQTFPQQSLQTLPQRLLQILPQRPLHTLPQPPPQSFPQPPVQTNTSSQIYRVPTTTPQTSTHPPLQTLTQPSLQTNTSPQIYRVPITTLQTSTQPPLQTLTQPSQQTNTASQIYRVPTTTLQTSTLPPLQTLTQPSLQTNTSPQIYRVPITTLQTSTQPPLQTLTQSSLQTNTASLNNRVPTTTLQTSTQPPLETLTQSSIQTNTVSLNNRVPTTTLQTSTQPLLQTLTQSSLQTNTASLNNRVPTTTLQTSTQPPLQTLTQPSLQTNTSSQIYRVPTTTLQTSTQPPLQTLTQSSLQTNTASQTYRVPTTTLQTSTHPPLQTLTQLSLQTNSSPEIYRMPITTLQTSTQPPLHTLTQSSLQTNTVSQIYRVPTTTLQTSTQPPLQTLTQPSLETNTSSQIYRVPTSTLLTINITCQTECNRTSPSNDIIYIRYVEVTDTSLQIYTPPAPTLQTTITQKKIKNTRNITSSQQCDYTVPSKVLSYNVTSYNVTKFQNYNSHCGCKKNCIRKCCRPEFVLKKIKGQLKCYKLRNNTALTVPFYKHVSFINRENVTSYVTGIMNCTILIQRDVYKRMYPQKDDNVVYDAFHPKTYWNSDDLCVENFYKGPRRKRLVVLMCYDKEPVIIIGGTVSSFFILATFLVLSFQPQKNIYTKILLVHTFSVAMAFISLSFAHMIGKNGSNNCLLSAYLSLFFFMSSLTCINIICIDIYLSFRGYFGLSKDKHENKQRIIFYSLYVILTPLFYIVMLILLEKFKTRLVYIHPPHVGHFSCFLEKGLPYFIYFHAPVGIVHVINIVLFILTVISIRNQKKTRKILEGPESRQFKAEIHSFILYLKLCLCMGLNWFLVFSIETLSLAFYEHYVDTPFWLGNSPYAAYLNMSNGVLIFFMVAWKKNYWNNIKESFRSFWHIMYKKQDVATNDSTQTTSTTDSTKSSNLALHM